MPHDPLREAVRAQLQILRNGVGDPDDRLEIVQSIVEDLHEICYVSYVSQEQDLAALLAEFGASASELEGFAPQTDLWFKKIDEKIEEIPPLE